MEQGSGSGPSVVKARIPLIISGVVIAVVGALAGVFVAIYLDQSKIDVPQTVVMGAKSPIYIPSKLPGTYKIVEDSFTQDEDTVIFWAADGAGGKLVFTEQQKPTEFNFDDFYKAEISDTKIINNVPYPSVWGKGGLGRYVLSVVTSDTWILMNTTAPLGEDGMRLVAEHIAPLR